MGRGEGGQRRGLNGVKARFLCLYRLLMNCYLGFGYT